MSRYLPVPSDNNTNAARQNSLWRSSKKAPRAPSLRTPALVAFWSMLAGLLTLLIYYRFSGPARTGLLTNSGFEKFMDSQSIGVYFMMTALGVLIRQIWSVIEKRIRMLEPYRRLALGSASPDDTVLVDSSAIPLTAIVASLCCQHFFVASISTIAIIAELLTVALAGIPFDNASSYTAYTVSTYLSVTILSLMLMALAAILWRSRGDPAVLYEPGSIAAVALSLCESRMVGQCAGLAIVDRKTRNGRVRDMGRRYWSGEMTGEDGVESWGVDSESDGGKEGRGA